MEENGLRNSGLKRPLSEESKRQLRSRIIEKLQEKYDETVAECLEVQENFLKKLREEADQQSDYSKYGDDQARSLTLNEILDLERQGK